MEYLIGSKEEFFDFIEHISNEDKIAILTHNDLDGIASAVFLEKILEAKDKKLDFLNFLEYDKEKFSSYLDLLKDKGITKLFLTDFSADGIDLELFEKLRRSFDVFLIDHHPVNPELQYKHNIIKTNSSDCSAITIYDLGKEIIDRDEWNWLACAAIFSDMSYKNPENMNFIQRVYPDFPTDEFDMASSNVGMISRKISTALIYYSKDLMRVYELIKDKNLEELSRAFEIVEGEIDKLVNEFNENAEFFPEKKLYYYKINPVFNVSSYVCTLVSKYRPEFSFVCVSDLGGEFLKVSSRNQSLKEDMGALMKKGIRGLNNAVAGGHVPAAAARFKKEDLERFKRNLLE